MRKIAIIGGTGVYSPASLQDFQKRLVQTPYGAALCNCGELYGNQVVFITRHGPKHSVAPHMINYRANIWALKSLGVEEIFATTAVGSCNPEMQAGHFVVCDQLIDLTKNRINTFFDNPVRGVAHADFTQPYCATLRNKVIHCLAETDITFHKTGCYVCTEGPRFETPAEIKMFAKLGGDLVGMTNVPEVVLAHEAEICYATVSMVTNYAAGISETNLTHAEVLETMAANAENIKNLIMKSIELMDLSSVHCACDQVLAEFGGFKL